MNPVRLIPLLFLPGQLLAQVALPDLQVITPTNLISIGNPKPSTRELRFSHITWDGGAGPLEIRPTYNATTGLTWAVQRLYTSNLTFVQDVPIALPMYWMPPSDYQFAMSRFGLYTDVNGAIGTLVAPSPKVNFCMTADVFVGGVPNSPNSTAYSPSDCTDPNGILGLSVGWGDQYDYTDPGENINITSLPDGTYWLRSIADPNNVLQDSNRSNNVTDTQLRINGNTVTVLQQQHPDSTPPNVTVSAPANGASVNGTVTLSASASATNSPVQSVQFIVDGAAVGAPITSPPYSTTWNSTPGSHVITAQAIAVNGFIGTASPVSVTVPVALGPFVIDQNLSVDGLGAVSTAPFSAPAGDLLVAFVGSDGPIASQSQSVNVSGAGLNWTSIVRTNAQAGDSEIWAASAPSSLSNVSISSSPTAGGFHQSLTLLALHGSGGAAQVGAHGTNNAATGPESVSLTTTQNGSWVVGVGSDWDGGLARTLGTNPPQTLLHQWFDPAIGTFWTQALSGTIAASGTPVTLNDTKPTNDRFDYSAVEITSSGPAPTPTPTPSPTPTPPPDTTPPVVSLINPVSSQTVSGTITVSANATDNVALASVNPVVFFVGTTPLPGTVTANPPTFSLPWDTTRTANGTYQFKAVATDSSGNQATAVANSVTVTNPGPTPVCFTVDVSTSVHGQGPVTTAPFTDAQTGELVLAFVGSDGPNKNRGQSITVSGAGLSWSLVKRANAQRGDAEIWAASAPSLLSNVTVTAQQSVPGYDMNLYVICVAGTNGVGRSVAASAANGAPTLSLVTSAAGSLIYATGNDWDNAIPRTVGSPSSPNQLIENQWLDTLDTPTGDTYWTQNQTDPGSILAGATVILNDTAPTTDRWNFVGVEILREPN